MSKQDYENDKRARREERKALYWQYVKTFLYFLLLIATAVVGYIILN